MNWTRVNQYYWQADCAYRIAKSKTCGASRYTAFHVPPGVQQYSAQKTFNSILDAAAWCDQHQESNRNAN